MTPSRRKRIAILGSTGSIGTQALQVIAQHPDRYEAYVLTAAHNVELLIGQARRFLPEAVVIACEEHYPRLKEALSDLFVHISEEERSRLRKIGHKPMPAPGITVNGPLNDVHHNEYVKAGM